MKRCIVTGVRKSEDNKTKDKLLFVTLHRLPSKMKNGGLWFPKLNEPVVTACFNQSTDKDGYEKYSALEAGAICDVTYGVNEFNGKVFVARLNVVMESPYDKTDLYV